MLAMIALIPLSSESQVLRLGATTYSFGVFEGDDTQVLGSINDVAVSAGGDIVFTDELTQRVTWIKPDGALGGVAGKPGAGPEEFRSLSAVDFHPDGRFLVLNSNKLVFLVPEQGGLRFDGELRLEVFPEDYCILGQRLFVLALHDGKILHEIDWNGELVSSFGEPLAMSGEVSPRFQANMDFYSAQGALTCFSDLQLLIVVPYLLPEIRAFSLEGIRAWTRVQEPYARTTMNELPGGRYQVAADPKTGTTHLSLEAWPLSERTLVVQVVESARFGPEGLPTELRFFNVATGEPLGRQDAGPSHIVAFTDAQVVAWEDLPFPRLFKRQADLTIQLPRD